MLQSIISVDPSLRSTGVTLLTLEPESNRFELNLSTIESVKGDERILVLKNLFKTIFGMCRKSDVDFGIVEGYSFMSEGNAYSQTIEAGASCRIGMAVSGIPLVEIPPGTWKKVVLRNGHASKKEIKEMVADMTSPGKQPTNVISRLFLSNLPEGWKSPDELDSLLIMIAFFNLLIKEKDYFSGSSKTLSNLKENMIASLKVNGLVKKSARPA